MARAQGHWVWFELYTPDVAASVLFYTEVLGWTKDAMAMPDGGTYTMLAAGKSGGDCGVMAPPMPGIPPMWSTYVKVDDVDATAAKLQAAGGKVFAPPFNVPGVGRMCPVADAEGATFHLFKSAAESDAVNEGLAWNELSTHDPEAAVAFYTKVLGYTAESTDMNGMTYHLLSAPDGQQACGVMKAQDASIPAMWLPYLATAVDRALELAAQRGGAVIMPAVDVPGVGRFGILQDPQGAVVGVHQS